ncbi:MAG: alpha-L-fucosidase [Cyclobacteriaceae bacterium]|nr:alpha-L-fucosidase [Cyclobacteriaceae bacterium]UYN88535.1 MAG: alpha-L-fucosidase [Cyclobacteriaceae bacterium]
MKRFFIAASLLIVYGCSRPELKPFGAVPSASQLKWHELEYYMFIHFGPNTFTNVEWGHGNENPEVFNPTQLDCRQWAATAKQAGMKGIIITAKHHDGFCLWPSRFSTHTVRESAWKNGEGDVLRELSEACREYGLMFGVYLSPWDRNHPDYGTPEYNQVFVNMLEEVLTNYGEVFEQWFDGANGEGPHGKKQEYDWPLFNSTVYKHQPNAIIFSDAGPGCRWVGNENGFAGLTNWNTLNVDKVYPGYPDFHELTSGHEDGTHWVPAECDVSIRPGWFYSPDTDDKVKSLEELVEIYYGSVGRGSNLLLNVPVDRRGLIPYADSVRLMELAEVINKSFKENLAVHAYVRSSSSLGNYKAGNLIDNNPRTYWASADLLSEIELTFSEAITFNRIVLQEGIEYGQRVKEFAVDVWRNDRYEELDRQTTLGYKRILSFDDLTTTKVRVRITKAKAPPVLDGIQLFKVE